MWTNVGGITELPGSNTFDCPNKFYFPLTYLCQQYYIHINKKFQATPFLIYLDKKNQGKGEGQLIKDTYYRAMNFKIHMDQNNYKKEFINLKLKQRLC